MRGISLWFFLSATLYLTAGLVFGIFMSMSGDHSLSPVHGHLNLIGWALMAVFGLFYQIVPQAAESRLAVIHFILSTLGLWIIVPGIAFAIRGATEAVVAAGSLITAASMLLFIVVVIRSRAGPA
jgi:hypothetical protein